MEGKKKEKEVGDVVGAQEDARGLSVVLRLNLVLSQTAEQKGSGSSTRCPPVVQRIWRSGGVGLDPNDEGAAQTRAHVLHPGTGPATATNCSGGLSGLALVRLLPLSNWIVPKLPQPGMSFAGQA